MATLILMRHGESQWNKKNLFTGWVDVPLSQKGIEEAILGGKQIQDISIDVIIMTTLIRSQMTAMLAMSQNNHEKTPVILHPGEGKMEEWGNIYGEEAKKNVIFVTTCWELNERMYGELQGLNKLETAQKYGKEQVQKWRRDYATCPPNGESLQMTAERSIPYFKNTIVPLLEKGKNVFVSAHGNSLRSIVMYLDKLNEKQVVSLEIPTGAPLLYLYENGVFKKTELKNVNT